MIATQTGTTNRQFFISFTEADLDMATALNRALNENGYSTWFHPRDCPKGQDVIDWMDVCLDNSVQVLALFSPEYFSRPKGFSHGELSAAMYEQLSDKDTRLVPVMLKDCEPPPLMKPLSFIDLRGLLQVKVVKQLIDDLTTPERMVNRSKADATTRSQARPHTFNIAGQPNPHFIGRDISLARLHNYMMAPSTQVTAITAQGMGGVGKTSLVREYAFRHGVAALYSGVWWIEAETEISILTSYEKLANEPTVGVEPGQDQKVTASAVRQWLSQQPDDKPWLLIFDNAPDAETIAEWLPAPPVRTIITTRRTDMDAISTPFEIGVWPVEDTIEFLKRRIGRGTHRQLESLAQRLGGLPLAAEQAGAFLKSRKTTSFENYEAHLTENLKKRPPKLSGTYPDSVFTTFETALEDLRQREFGEAALGILNICAYLSPDGVEVVLLTAAAQQTEILPEPLRTALSDETSRSVTIAALLDYSLMRLGHDGGWGQTLHLHPLIRAVVLSMMTEDETQRIAQEISDFFASRLIQVSIGSKDRISGNPYRHNILAGQKMIWGRDTDVNNLCGTLASHVSTLNEHEAQFITFEYLLDASGKSEIDGELISALNMLVSSRKAILEYRALYLTADGSERELSEEDIELAILFDEINDPAGGENIKNVRNRIRPFFAKIGDLVEVP